MSMHIPTPISTRMCMRMSKHMSMHMSPQFAQTSGYQEYKRSTSAFVILPRSLNVCVDMRVGMHIDTRADTRADMCTDVCIDMRRFEVPAQQQQSFLYLTQRL